MRDLVQLRIILLALLLPGCASLSDTTGISETQEALTFTVSPMVGGNHASTTCAWEHESVPVFLQNGTGANLFAGIGGGIGEYDVSVGSWNSWSSLKVLQETNLLGGDKWGAAYAPSQLAYASGIGTDANNHDCQAVAVTSWANLSPDTWTYPATCIDSRIGCPSNCYMVDQPQITVDRSTIGTIWTGYNNGSVTLEVYRCHVPGAAYGCPPSSSPVSIGGGGSLSFELGWNPCTHHLVVAHRTDAGIIELYFYDAYLTQTGHFTVRTGQPGGQSYECTGKSGQFRHCGMIANCGASSSCIRNNGHPSLAVRRNAGGTCYAAIAYDSWNIASDGHNYTKSRLDIVNVSNESAPSLTIGWLSTDPSFTWNQLLSEVVVSDTTDNIGWFWLSDNIDSCHVGEEGVIDSHFMLTGSGYQPTGKFNGTFPLANFGGFFTDYNAGAQGYGSGGYLFPAWNQAVANTAGQTFNCQQCTVDGATKYYNIGAFVARFLP